MFKINLFIFISVLSLSNVSLADKKDHTLSFQFENDFFGGGTDRHFSHGTRFELLSEPLQWVTNLADKLPWFDSNTGSGPEDGLEGRGSISIGQSIYTPENTYTSELVPDERPYAGWLYIGFGLMANQGNEHYDRYDKLQLEIGVVGPMSYAEEVQKFIHSVLGNHMPQGWDHQLKNEPGIVLYYEQAYRIFHDRKIFSLDYDIVPHLGGSLGNIFTYFNAGCTLRVGRDLKNDFGPPRINPSLPGGGAFSTDRFSWNVFAGLGGRVVLQNIFLDGNTFKDSHSVKKKILVGDLQAGFSLRWKRFGISYTQIFRTKEFKGQDSDDIFGAINMSWYFK